MRAMVWLEHRPLLPFCGLTGSLETTLNSPFFTMWSSFLAFSGTAKSFSSSFDLLDLC